MRFLDRTLPSPAENLALDEALLLEAEAGTGGEVLRLWEWPSPAVVLGAGGQLAVDVDEATCARDGVPILRRASGGGTVLLGRGCLLFSLVLSYETAPPLADITASYRTILGRVSHALRSVHPETERAGISDLAVGGRKFSGNAQQRKRAHVLHHGTLLYDFDLDAIGSYLRMPERQPEYRQGRGHREFVMNLPADADTLKQLLRNEWGAGEELSDWPQARVAELVAEKYAREDWVRRR